MAETPDNIGSGTRSDQEFNTIVISSSGDLILSISTSSQSLSPSPAASSQQPSYTSFRVSTAQLRSSSLYFQLLLSPTGNFSEGPAVARQHEALRSKYPNSDWEQIASAELPRVDIGEIGQTSTLKQPQLLVRDFLLILHETPGELSPRKMPLVNLANLAVVADRFDATAALKTWAKKKGFTNIAATKLSAESEESLRQRTFVGMFFQHDAWMYHTTTRLIMTGSKRWTTKRHGHSRRDSTEFLIEGDEDESLLPMWWYLPRGVEEELLFRRNSILATLAALQSDLLALYTSKTQQCRLGYDTSPQCDSFQLGEFVRFLASRIGTLDLVASFASHPSPSPVHTTGASKSMNILTLIANLRQAPAYQINKDHSHCGPRKALLCALDQISVMLARDVGICIECWGRIGGSEGSNSNNNSAAAATEHFWSKVPPSPFCKRITAQQLVQSDCRIASVSTGTGGERRAAAAHAVAREFFCARDREWDWGGQSTANVSILRITEGRAGSPSSSPRAIKNAAAVEASSPSPSSPLLSRPSF